MNTRRPLVLLTGFGPFPGVPVNASGALARAIAERAAPAFPGYRFAAHELPTEWHRGPAIAADLVEAQRPAVALHFGVARRARGFEIELRGSNATCAVTDAVGDLPAGACLLGDGTPALAARLPAGAIVERLRRLGIPARLSRDAGRYLCNAVLYRSLATGGAAGAAACCGFIHVPEALVPPRGGWSAAQRGATMSFAEGVAGGLEIIAACIAWPGTRARARLAPARTHAARVG